MIWFECKDGDGDEVRRLRRRKVNRSQVQRSVKLFAADPNRASSLIMITFAHLGSRVSREACACLPGSNKSLGIILKTFHFVGLCDGTTAMVMKTHSRIETDPKERR